MKRKTSNTATGSFQVPKVNVSIQISEAQFQKLSRLVYSLCGIKLGPEKKDLLKARLVKRFRAVGCQDVGEYMRLLEKDADGSELVCFLDCITTNKTDFFREPQHFSFLAEQVLPRLDKLCRRGEPLRIWSAACSTGEEPYTIAMVLLENRHTWADRGAKILASDISTRVLAHAQQAVYSMDRVEGIPRRVLTRYFQRGQRRWTGYVRLKKEVRELVSFRRINLMDSFRFSNPFHVIFCRNVMIYFDKETRERLVGKFCEVLCPRGYLLVGHSESLTGIDHKLKFVRPAVYRKEV